MRIGDPVEVTDGSGRRGVLLGMIRKTDGTGRYVVEMSLEPYIGCPCDNCPKPGADANLSFLGREEFRKI